jgi:hypothetical protein
MTLVLPTVKGSALNVTEFEANYAHFTALAATKVATDDSRLSDSRSPTTHSHPQSDVINLVTDMAAKASTASVTAGLALKLDADAAAVSNARAIADGNYTLFTVSSSVASMTTATPTQIFAGTAGKGIGADGLYAAQQPTTVASSSGVLTLNWTAANIPTYLAQVSVTENITSIAVSNLPLWQTCIVLFELAGSYTIVVPSHGATVDSRTFYRIDNDTWPSFPSEDGAVVVLAFTKSATRIYCGVAGLSSAP